MKDKAGINSGDYSVVVKRRGRDPLPWRWEIYVAGKSNPEMISNFYETMSEAMRAGKTALAEVRAKLAT